MTSLISSVSWVPRGSAARHPRRYALDDTELERVGKLAGARLEEVKQELEEAELADGTDPAADEGDGWEDESGGSNASGTDGEANGDVDMDDAAAQPPVSRDPDDLSAYNLENYDEEKSRGVAQGAFSNVKGLQYYRSQEEDPYITLKDSTEDDETEREDLEIYPSDNLLVAAKTEDDVSQLEIYVYDEAEDNFYVHHDLLLPAMPLCLEWMDFTPAGIATSGEDRRGNFVAVGTMDPEVEVWSLDVVDGLYPDAILGGGKGDAPPETEPDMSELASTAPPSPDKKKKKKKKKKNPVAPGVVATHHTGAVLSLSHNRQVRNLLLSASADTTVKLWDLNQPPIAPRSTFSAIRSFDLHGDKVQSVSWNPTEAAVALSGGWDACARVWDTRTPNDGVGVKVDSDVECLKWDPWSPFGFLVALENGLVQAFDSRTLGRASPRETPPSSKGKAKWTLAAHDGAVAAIEASQNIKGCLVTGGVDKTVKVWNMEEGQNGKASLSMVISRDLGVGKVFSTSFCPDDPTTLAVAGSKANLVLWDIASNGGVRAVFGDRLKAVGYDLAARKARGGDGVLAVVDDPETDDDSDA